MLRSKKYDWKDSNLALFGSDVEKQVKKESAETEKAWQSCKPDEVGTVIWRIEKFKVVPQTLDDFGTFFGGDSYIVLNKYKQEGEDEIKYDVHFWIGKLSSQDEYGTAAYKTVELDTFLDDKPVQHRQVQGHESDLFKSYFHTLTILNGGVDSGFKRVSPKEYGTRLLQVVGERNSVIVKEIAAKVGNVNEEDTFILDRGLEIIVYQGRKTNKDEKFKAMQFVQGLRSQRGGKPKVTTIDGKITDTAAFTRNLKSSEIKEKPAAVIPTTKEMHRLSDKSGSMTFTQVDVVGDLNKDLLSSDDVFIIDSGKEVFVWVGSGASIDERRQAMSYGHNYLFGKPNPLRPITVVAETQTSAEFDAAF